MADVIHEVDPNIPVHAKIMNTVFARGCIAWGIDPELFCGLSQIAGNDCCKWYVHQKDTWASDWQGENMFFDLLRSIKGQPIFNSENHVIIDRDLQYVDPNHIRNIIWQSAVHGEVASTMWVWERTYDNRSDFAGSIMHRPECCEAHGRTALDLMRLAPEVTALQQAPARVAIVYSIASLLYNTEYQRLVSRVYQALNFTGEKVDFITERQLAAGQASQYQVIFAPGVTHLPEDSLKGLAAARTVVTLGPKCFTRDDLDREWTGPQPAHVRELPDVEGVPLRDAIVTLLGELKLPRPVVVQDVKGEKEAWGVEWLTADVAGGRIVNLVNYLQVERQVRITGPKGKATNLLSGAPAPEVLTLKPLEPVMLKWSNR
jgi:hypothetical protein